jgi:DeoR/GlpR family transcriptional regulator of sugar metabolism
MLKRERQNIILRKVNIHNKVLSFDLCLELGVSEDTIRRDLNEMAAEGKLIKVHGGALSKSFHHYQTDQPVYALEDKLLIAQKASNLIQNGMLILTTGGTTIIELARALSPELKATIVTVSIPAANAFLEHPHIEVIFLGDKILKDSKIAIGAQVMNGLQQLQADICFLGTNAIDADLGLTDSDWEVAAVKRAMIQASRNVVALAISEKLQTQHRIKICDIAQIGTLVTELHPQDARLLPYRNAGITTL